MNTTETPQTTPKAAHSDQARYGVGREVTEKLLEQAGIQSGMRVLDLGCGQGDVSLIAASMVGPKGKVIGVDRSEVALSVAQGRAVDAGYGHVSFLPADLNDFRPPQQHFDAVVGRRVLMYLSNPAQTLERAALCLVSNGVTAFQEHDGSMVPACATPFPLHEQVTRWVWETVEKEGANRAMGFTLPSVFAAAGFTLEGLHVEAIPTIKTKPSAIGSIVRAMLPRIVAQGVATEAEIALETLDQRLEDERQSTDSVFISDIVFAAWARK